MNSSNSRNKLLDFLLEFGPLIVFWLCNSYGEKLMLYYPVMAHLGGSLFIATVVFMVTTFLSLGCSWFLFREIKAVPLISGICVMIFGGLTIWFHDETFIKMKPTILYFICFAILFIGYMFGKIFLKILLAKAICMDSIGWRKLTIRWAFFFLFLSFLNELVWRNFSTETWMLFKIIGIFPIVLVFGIFQVNLIKTHMQTFPSEEDND